MSVGRHRRKITVTGLQDECKVTIEAEAVTESQSVTEDDSDAIGEEEVHRARPPPAKLLYMGQDKQKLEIFQPKTKPKSSAPTKSQLHIPKSPAKSLRQPRIPKLPTQSLR